MTPIDEIEAVTTRQELQERFSHIMAALGPFKACTTLDDAKKVYRTKVKTTHPDAGGSTESQIALESHYRTAVEVIKARNRISKLLERYEVAVKPKESASKTSVATPFIEHFKSRVSSKKATKKISKAAGVLAGEVIRSGVGAFLDKIGRR